MGKKAKQKAKKNQASDNSRTASLKQKGVMDKLAKLASRNSSLKAGQKGLKKQGKVLQKAYAALAVRCQKVESQGETLLKGLSRLQMESGEIEARLSAEIGDTAQFHDRLGRLESTGEADRAQVSALKRQMERQLQLVESVRDRLEALEPLVAGLSDELKAVVPAPAGAAEPTAFSAPVSAYDRPGAGDAAGGQSIRLEDIGHLRMRVDVLEGHLVDLDGKGREYAQALEALQADSAQPASLQVERLSEQIEALQAGKVELASRVSRLATDVIELESSNSDLGSGVVALSARLDQTSTQLGEISAQDRLSESWIENLKQADSDLSLRVDQQQRQVQGLVEQAEAFDRAVRETAESSAALKRRLGGLEQGLTTTELRLVDNDAALEKRSQNLESEHKRLAAGQRQLLAGVLATGALLLILAGIGYWAIFNQEEDATTALSQQVEQMSQRIAQQDGRLTGQGQRFAALQEEGERSRVQAEAEQKVLREVIEGQGKAAGEQAARLARIESAQDQADLRLDQFGRDRDALQERLKGLLDLQGDMAAALIRLEEEGGGMGRRLTALVAERAEREAPAGQRLEKPGSSDERSPEPRVQRPAADAPASAAGPIGVSWSTEGGKQYTIQIVAAYDVGVVLRVASRQDLQEARAIYKRTLNHKDWYMLLYGRFSSAGEAKSAIRGLPAEIRANGPWVRNLASVQGMPYPPPEL